MFKHVMKTLMKQCFLASNNSGQS